MRIFKLFSLVLLALFSVASFAQYPPFYPDFHGDRINVETIEADSILGNIKTTGNWTFADSIYANYLEVIYSVINTTWVDFDTTHILSADSILCPTIIGTLIGVWDTLDAYPDTATVHDSLDVVRNDAQAYAGDSAQIAIDSLASYFDTVACNDTFATFLRLHAKADSATIAFDVDTTGTNIATALSNRAEDNFVDGTGAASGESTVDTVLIEGVTSTSHIMVTPAYAGTWTAPLSAVCVTGTLFVKCSVDDTASFRANGYSYFGRK